MRTQVCICLFVSCALVHGQSGAGTGVLLPTSEALDSIAVEHPFHLPPDAELPKTVDRTLWFPPAGNQGKQYSCSGWSLGYGLTTYHYNTRHDRCRSGHADIPPWDAFSPAFHYANVLIREAKHSCTDGVSLEDAIHVACEIGCCWWKQFPYVADIDSCLRPWPQGAEDQAAANRMSHPLMLDANNEVQWKYHLSLHEPVIFQLTIDSSFHDGFIDHGEKPFTWRPERPMSMQGWQNRTGHILVCVGYDDVDSTFIILNSWGREWGFYGTFKLEYSTMDWICTEAYVLDHRVPLDPGSVPLRNVKRDLGADQKRRFGAPWNKTVRNAELSWYALSYDTDGSLLIAIVEPQGTDVVRTIDLREDQPTSFRHAGATYVFTFKGRSFISKRPCVHIEKGSEVQEAFDRRFLEKVEVHRAGRK